ncbi:energy transducer TonB [Qipengyuania sp. ASV99]|uniref:energy transducer TonB n=1 Tax=Qipengyuania sp. ASV99 TaxID=3399681 RepID=UPI003A4C68D8
MSYSDTANRANPAAALGALGVPAAMGVLLVTGLAITQVIVPPIANPVATNFEVPKIEPIDDPVDPKASTRPNPDRVRDTVITRPDSDFDFTVRDSGPIGELPGLDDGLGDVVGPVDFGIPRPTPSPSFTPVAAAPRGNPGRWITDSDYRTSWINRGYSGVAGFELSVDARGRVSNCTITRSTGHAPLDEATCRLLERRASFDPARNSSGEIVAGRYSSSVSWKIPE